MITYARSTSSGLSLSQHLTIGIFDYVRAFGHEPKLIVLPWWRRAELDWPMEWDSKDMSCTFRGIPFRFSMILDVIELS